MKTRIFTLALLALCVPVFAAPKTQTATGLIKPPAINIPSSGTVTTELNLGNDDLLPVFKQMLPEISKLLSTMPGAGGIKLPSIDLSKMNLEPLLEALTGVTAIRVVVVNYPSTMDGKKFLAAFEVGVPKTGQFSRVVSDSQLVTGTMAVYSQANNQGYLAFNFDPTKKTAIVARIMGNLDMQKVMMWAVGMAKATPPESKPADAPVPANP